MASERTTNDTGGLARLGRALAYRARRLGDRLRPPPVAPPGEAGRAVWIHVGVHKTGSTTLQYLLRHATLELARQSVAYERGGYELGALLRKHAPLEAADFSRERAGVVARLDACGARVALTSSESFMGDPFVAYASTAHIAADLRRLYEGRDVSIVALVRRQDDFVASLYQQHVKEGGGASPAAFIASLPETPFDWDARLRAFDAEFGAERVFTRAYETVFADGRHAVERAFAGLDAALVLPIENTPRRNPSLSATGLRILAASNEFVTDEERGVLRRLLQEHFPRIPGEPAGVLTVKQRAAILDRHRSANERLFASRLSGDPAEAYYLGSATP